MRGSDPRLPAVAGRMVVAMYEVCHMGNAQRTQRTTRAVMCPRCDQPMRGHSFVWPEAFKKDLDGWWFTCECCWSHYFREGETGDLHEVTLKAGR